MFSSSDTEAVSHIRLAGRESCENVIRSTERTPGQFEGRAVPITKLGMPYEAAEL